MNNLKTTSWHIRETVDRGEKPERLKDIKEQYLNGATIRAFVTYNCIMNQLDLIEEALEKRIRSVPSGWFRWKGSKKNLVQLLSDLEWTIPQEKLDGLNTMVKRTRCEYREGPAVTFQRNTDMIVPTKDAVALAYYSWDGKCKMCCKQSCQGCRLCDALDRVLTTDRKGAMWNQVDITEGTK